jgi:succinate dehydrogenase / fumarate reductase cytochrome b subunit
VLNYGYSRNWFYVFQRVTGVFLFFFLFFHILNFRFGLIPGLNLVPVAGNADRAFSIVSNEFQSYWVLGIYILGVTATAWHLAYGFWLFAVDWGIVIGEKAQRVTLYASLALAVFLSAVGINAAAAFVKRCGLLPSALCEQAERNRIVEPSKF